MSLPSLICKSINKCFPLPVHPFNLNNQKIKTYGEWQFEKGEDTIKFYLNKVNKNEMFKDKIVLDIGCGAAGKTLYYASLDAKKIYGVEILEKYKEEANNLATQKNLDSKFEFVIGDASKLSFKDNFFDVIIMNDALEHVDAPSLVLKECYRVLKPGGRLYLNFPPYFHPYGAHLSDAIGIPWVHLFFSDNTLIQTYKSLVKSLPDGEDRINFRISKDSTGKEYFSYINKMTIRKFNKLFSDTSYKVIYKDEVPLRNIFSPLTKIPILRECFIKMVVYILEK